MLQNLTPGTVIQPRQDNKDAQVMDAANGYLVVEVSLPNGEPVSLATVMIYIETENNIEILKVLLTGINGKTETICIAGKGANNSICGVSISASFSKFTIRVDTEGCYTNIFRNAQILGGQTTLQKSVMVPLPFGVKNRPGLEKVYDLTVPQTK